jgi:Ca2+-binding EF-hand superfamily protein
MAAAANRDRLGNAAVMKVFSQADKNKDGSLSNDEFQAVFGK